MSRISIAISMACILYAFQSTAAPAPSTDSSLIADIFGFSSDEKPVENDGSLKSKGYALLKAGKTDAAIDVFDDWIDKEPKEAGAYHGMALALDLKKEHLKAQEYYAKALQLKPASVAIKNNLALSYIMSNQPMLAIGELEGVRKRAPKNAKVRYNLALAYGVSGKPEKARALLAKDLPEKQIQENLAAYRLYAERLKQQPAAAKKESVIDNLLKVDVEKTYPKPKP